MKHSETILIWIIAIEFLLVLLFVISTYLNRFYWMRVSAANDKKTEDLRKEILESIDQGKARKLSFPDRIDLIVPLFQGFDTEFLGKSNQWISVRTELVKEQVLPRSRKLMNKRNWLNKYYLCILMEYYCERQDEAIILKLLKSESIVTVINAIKLAIQFDSPKVLRAVIDRISVERSPVQRMLVADAFQTSKLLEMCHRILKTSENAFLHKTCYILLNQVGCTSEFFELAKRDLQNNQLEVQLNAIRVLSKSDSARALPILKFLLDSPVWQIREVALTNLGPMKDKDIYEKIGSMLQDPVWWVRYRAGMALLNYKQEGIELLKKISESTLDNYAATEANYILLRHHLQEKS